MSLPAESERTGSDVAMTGETSDGLWFRLLFRDCEADLARDLPAGSCALVVTSPPFFKVGTPDEDPEETWEQHWTKRRAMLDACIGALRPGGKLALHLADCPNFEWQTGATEGKLIPAVYADYLRATHNVVLWDRFIWVQPEPWTHYQHAKRLLLPNGGLQSVVDVAHLTRVAVGRQARPAMEESRLGWEYLLVFRTPGPLTGPELRELACLGWDAAWVEPTGTDPGGVRELPSASEAERSWLRRAVWQFDAQPEAEAQQGASAHPSAWPAALPERLITLYSQPGDWVLDPYLGAGTTAAAALRLGRHVVGYETWPAYVAALRERFGGVAATRAKPEAAVREGTPRNG